MFQFPDMLFLFGLAAWTVNFAYIMYANQKQAPIASAVTGMILGYLIMAYPVYLAFVEFTSDNAPAIELIGEPPHE